MNYKKENDLEFVSRVAKEAGLILMNHFGTDVEKNIKGEDDDFVTKADLESEKFIINNIKSHYPNDNIVAEESGDHGIRDAEYTWIVDPLDGTHNFVNQRNSFGVFVARTRGNQVEMSVAFDPRNNILAHATVGGGTYINGKKITLDLITRDDLPLSMNRELHEQLQSIGVADDVPDFSAIGPTLATLKGSRSAYVVNVGSVWDFATPSLLFLEAGWEVTDLAGNEYIWDGVVEFGHPGIVAAPKELHSRIMSELIGS